MRQRLKVAKVNPRLIAAYHKGETTLEHLMASTVSDDHTAQEEAWAQLPEWRKNDPSCIRDMLTAHEITASDRRVAFVTLKAYRKAGGSIRRDLFSECFSPPSD